MAQAQVPCEAFQTGSVYLAGFAQVRAPHIGLLIPINHTAGVLFHIRIDRQVSPSYWARQKRMQKIAGDMFLSSLLKIADRIPIERLVKKNGLLKMKFSGDESLEKEFQEFVEGNKVYARRDRFPNVAVSKFCS